MRALRSLAAATLVLVVSADIAAQRGTPTRLSILIAEDERAGSSADLATIRAGLRSRDPETARIAVRALGRLERPELIGDLIPQLRSAYPEIRVEAANAIGQAAHGLVDAAPKRSPAVRSTSRTRATSAPAGTLDSAADALIARLSIEDEPSVRGALCQTLGRLPYTTSEQVQKAERALLQVLAREDSTDGRLGVAQGFEALIRLRRSVRAPSEEALTRLVGLASAGTNGAARVRRLALEALIAARGVSDALVARAVTDGDAQVRRLAIRAASLANSSSADVLKHGLADSSPMVRFEALRAMVAQGKAGDACGAILGAVHDRDAHVALLALDELASCSLLPDAVAVLSREAAADLAPRRWHRAAHALVALAAADPEQAKAAVSRFVASDIWLVRVYAARAAAVLGDRTTLQKLAADPDDNVCEAAIVGLSKLAGGDAASAYVAALGRRGYQAIREAARALTGESHPSGTNGSNGVSKPAEAAIAALQSTLQRLDTENRDNSRDARAAIVAALESFGVRAEPLKPIGELPIESELTAEALHRLSSARARVTMRGLGPFELALFTSQAPATVVRFARLAEAGYYNGLTFHRVVPNFVIQGGSPGANEYIGDASYMRDEVGLWPHVRGAVGISTRGRDTGDAQIFVDLVDNPRLDHEYTVFAQVLSGMEIVDQILEGDVIDKVEILTQ
jgi:cyclophilin family peptidyl-prolyl cis-trans isomerase